MAEKLISEKDPVGAGTLQVISTAKKFNHWMFKVIQPYIQGKILEIGSGIGNISYFLVTNYQQVTLSDINAEYCHHLRRNFGDSSNLENIISLNLVDTHFSKKHSHLFQNFDTVILLNVIEHIEDHNLAVSNARMLLKKNGRLIILAPAFSTLFCNLDKALGHFRRYSKGAMRLLLENNGYKTHNNFYFNFTGIAGWLLFGKILRKKILSLKEVSIYDLFVPVSRGIDLITKKIGGLSIIFIAERT